MKLLRVFLLSVAAIVVLLAIAVGVAFNSSFQTWAARRALAGQPDLQASVGRVSAGLHRVEVQDVRAESAGAVLTLPSLETELPLIAAGVSRQVRVQRLVAKGWKLDLTHALSVTPTAAPGGGAGTPRPTPSTGGPTATPPATAAPGTSPEATAQAAFKGLFSQLKLPVDVALDGIDLEGDVILPPLHEAAPKTVHVVVRGDGIGPGRDGSLTADLDGTDPSGGRITLHAIVRPTMDTPHTFSRFAVTGEATATGTQFPKGVRLGVEATAARSTAGEDYHLALTGEQKPLATVDAGYVAATAKIAGKWKLNLRDSDLTPFVLGQPLPVFTATGEGSFDTDATFSEIHAAGGLDASAGRLEVVRPELSAIGTIKLIADFDLLQHAKSLRVERLSAEITGARPVAAVKALQPFEFNLETGELRVADPTKDLLGLSLQGLPLAWAGPFLGDLAVKGDDVRGEFAASARDGGLTLRPVSPLIMTHLSVAQAGRPLVRALDLSLRASADYTPQGWQAEVTGLDVKSGARALLTFNAKAGQLAGKKQPVKATGHWRAELPALLEQPVAAGSVSLSGGVAEGDFTASVDTVKSVQLKFTVHDLAVPTKETLPRLTLDVRADVAADGRITFDVPLVVEVADRKSDLTLAGTATPAKDVLKLDAQVKSEQLVAEDLQLLLLPLSGGGVSAAAPAKKSEKPAAKPAGPDAKPFWSGLEGDLVLALKKVSYGGTFQVTNVAGKLHVGASELKWDGVRAVFGADSDLKLAGGVRFTSKAKEPYTLANDLAVTNFDAGAAFRAIDPAKLPTVEGKLNVTSHVASEAGNVAALAEEAHGDFQLTGRGGIFRALSSDISDKIQKTQSAVSMIGGMIDSVRGKKQFGDYANKSEVVAEVAKRLSEIPFDQLSVTATREENLDLLLKDFTLISPELRLGGTGSIQHVDGKPLLQQPLSATLTIGSRGQIGDLMKKGGLLDEKKTDSLGYVAFLTPVKVGGTLENPDTSALRSALIDAALEKGGGLLNGLLGGGK